MGKVGKLDKDIEYEMIFWMVFQKYPEILIVEDELSFSRLQKMFAIIQMNNDYEKVIHEYDMQMMEKTKPKK